MSRDAAVLVLELGRELEHVPEVVGAREAEAAIGLRRDRVEGDGLAERVG